MFTCRAQCHMQHHKEEDYWPLQYLKAAIQQSYPCCWDLFQQTVHISNYRRKGGKKGKKPLGFCNPSTHAWSFSLASKIQACNLSNSQFEIFSLHLQTTVNK